MARLLWLVIGALLNCPCHAERSEASLQWFEHREAKATAEFLRGHENDSPPQREEGQGVVGVIVSERQPPLAPPYQGGEPFSYPVVTRRIMSSALRMTTNK